MRSSVYRRSLEECLIWSDPSQRTRIGDGTFVSPSPRGGGYVFGSDLTKKFLEKNNLRLLVRSHEVCRTGEIIHSDAISID